MKHVRRTFILATLAAAMLAACGQSETATEVVPLAITQGTSCSLDGMLLADYPGPKAQIHYAGQPEPDFFCDTVEMFHMVLNPEQIRAVQGIFVQDMGKADWDMPKGHWIDAKTAFYVYGSKRDGSMGPTIASFSVESDAAKFSAEYGGKVYRFADITADMVVLDGGVLHDSIH
ncbi:MAG: nitrous oxide reductase accessory protein NosL [Thiobacillus sp.]